MSFFNNLKNLKKVLHLGGGGNDAKKKRVFNNIRMDCSPDEYWEMIGELGDGAFGKVWIELVIYITKLDSVLVLIGCSIVFFRCIKLRDVATESWLLQRCVFSKAKMTWPISWSR